MKDALLGLLIFIVAVAVYHYVTTHPSGQDAGAAETSFTTSDASKHFRCEGKTRCTQMSSCEEATFYLRNCPNTKMDGDGDGVPCESQWCGE